MIFISKEPKSETSKWSLTLLGYIGLIIITKTTNSTNKGLCPCVGSSLIIEFVCILSKKNHYNYSTLSILSTPLIKVLIKSFIFSVTLLLIVSLCKTLGCFSNASITASSVAILPVKIKSSIITLYLIFF